MQLINAFEKIYSIKRKRMKVTNTWKYKYILCYHVQFFVTPWIVACHVPLSMGILQARILEWFAMPSHQGIFPTQGI